LRYADEQPVQISSIWIHPIRGILAKPVKHAFICPYGFKFDREMVLIDIESNVPLTSTSYIEATILTQEIIYEPRPLLRVISSKPLPLASAHLSETLDIVLTEDLATLNGG